VRLSVCVRVCVCVRARACVCVHNVNNIIQCKYDASGTAASSRIALKTETVLERQITYLIRARLKTEV